MPTITKYTKTISTDFANGKVDMPSLESEIKASTIAIAFYNVQTDPSADKCFIWFRDVLSAGDQTTLSNVCTAHSGVIVLPVQEVQIQEETIPTGGRFQVYGDEVTAGNNLEADKDVTFPFPINLLSGAFKAQSKGDKFALEIAPDLTIGQLSAAEAIGQTVLDVDADVMANISLGDFVKIEEGGNNDDGLVVSNIDIVNNTITVDAALANAYTTAADVKRTIKMVRGPGNGGLPSDLDELHKHGLSSIGGSFISANTVIRAKYYNNNGGSNKTTQFFLEYKY